MTERFTMPEILSLAASGVSKIDLLGPRGTTLVTCDELEAMACVVVMSGVLPPPSERLAAGEIPQFRSIRSKR